VDWGYRLLDEEEQALLRLLSVFAGGCTLESAEAVAGDARGTLDTLANLVDKSLVVFSGGRYRLLETVRQYAAERLAERGETVEARARHLDHFVDLCRTAEPHIFAGVNGRGYLERLESENDNLRAALDFCQLDPGRAVAGLRLATGMHWFWFVRGHLREGLGRTTAALARREAAPAPLRARGLAAAALLSLWVGDAAATAAFAAESAALAKSLGDPWVHASALCAGGAAALHTGDLDGAARLLTEGVALARVTGHDLMLAFALYWMATAELARGDLTAARAALAEDLELVRRRGHTMGLGHALLRLGEVAEAEANLDEARRHYLDSTRHVDPTDGWGLAQVLDGLGRVSVGEGRPDRGARLFGAVEALCERTGAQIRDSEPQRRAVAEAHRALGEPAFAAAWAEGRALRQDEAIALACEDA
jgi:tetratricopeptide (TPR) repeat protein